VNKTFKDSKELKWWVIEKKCVNKNTEKQEGLVKRITGECGN